MYQYKDEKHFYDKALELKHPQPVPIAKTHNTKQTEINMKFDTVEDVAGFVGAVFDEEREKVFKNEPDFLNPRKADEVRKDYSQNCTIIMSNFDTFKQISKFQLEPAAKIFSVAVD